jgi:3-hydroxybutyryl-CoA dehydratase
MDRDAFKAQLRAAFEEIEVGRTFTFRRTFNDGDMAIFCGVTGDYNPYHIDREFAAASWFGRPSVPGLLCSSMVTHIGGMLGFLATTMSFEFLGPVFPGDTITCAMQVVEKDPIARRLRCDVTFHNQDGKLVQRGDVSGFPGNVRLAR